MRSVPQIQAEVEYRRMTASARQMGEMGKECVTTMLYKRKKVVSLHCEAGWRVKE